MPLREEITPFMNKVYDECEKRGIDISDYRQEPDVKTVPGGGQKSENEFGDFKLDEKAYRLRFEIKRCDVNICDLEYRAMTLRERRADLRGELRAHLNEKKKGG